MIQPHNQLLFNLSLDLLKAKKVRIWSGEHLAYWRAEGRGYVNDPRDAGEYDFLEALQMVYAAGPEKRIYLEFVTA